MPNITKQQANKKENNYVFIDSNNLHLGIKSQGWILDFKRFKKYLEDKYKASKIFLFIGYVPGNESLYTFLQKAGYIVIFKPTLYSEKNGGEFTKGNTDAELVLHTMIEYSNYDKAIIVSGDGDFHCLIEYLIQKNKFKKLLIPNQRAYSVLLKGFSSEYLAFVSDLKQKLEYIKYIKRKKPHKDKTL